MDANKRKPANKVPPKKITFSFWYILVAFLIVYMIQTFLVSGNVEKVPYSEFKQLLKEGKIKECAISREKVMGIMYVETTGEVTADEPEGGFFGFNKNRLAPNEKYFETVRVDDKELVKELEAQNIKYSGKADDGWWQTLIFYWIFPIAILFLIWGFAFRRMNPQGGLMSIGRSRAKVYVQGKTKVTIKHVAAVDEAV
jgi:cell division protease FtsH